MLPQFFNIEHTAATHLLSFENTGRDDSNCWYSTSSLCSSSKLLMRPATACIAVRWTVAVCDSWARCEKQLNGKTRLESWYATQFGTSDSGPILGIPIACFGALNKFKSLKVNCSSALQLAPATPCHFWQQKSDAGKRSTKGLCHVSGGVPPF